jgi:DNA-binding NarL/FixJ family response regulator
MTDEQRTAVLLDRHPLWLDAVEQVLSRIGVAVVAKTTSPSRALEALEQYDVDVLLTEIELADLETDGISCIRRALERSPGLKAIVLSSHDDPQRVDAALDAGAVAYVVKTAHPDDIASAIRQAFAHSIYLAGTRAAAAPVTPTRSAQLADSPGLTRRELEILQLVSEGYSNAQLSRMLWVTEQTVKFHLSNIYRKLDVANRIEASRWAQMRGLLPATTAVPVTGAA